MMHTDDASLSVTVAPEMRGRGFGQDIVRELEEASGQPLPQPTPINKARNTQ